MNIWSIDDALSNFLPVNLVGTGISVYQPSQFLYFFCCHCTTNDWKCLFSYFVKGINKRRRNFVFLIRLYLQRKWGVISTKKVKNTRVLFYLKGDVFTAVLRNWRVAGKNYFRSPYLYQGPDVLTKETFPRMFYSIYVHMLLFAQLL